MAEALVQVRRYHEDKRQARDALLALLARETNSYVAARP